MTCEACEDARRVDGIEPECIAGPGCPIPPPGDEGSRILATRDLLLRLKDLIDPGTVCRMCNIDRDDLELLALVEDELRPPEKD